MYSRIRETPNPSAHHPVPSAGMMATPVLMFLCLLRCSLSTGDWLFCVNPVEQLVSKAKGSFQDLSVNFSFSIVWREKETEKKRQGDRGETD